MDMNQGRKAKMSESEFVRNAAMNRGVRVIDGLDELTTELRRQGNNLPQVATLLGISSAGAYELVRTAGFPSLTIGSRSITHFFSVYHIIPGPIYVRYSVIYMLF